MENPYRKERVSTGSRLGASAHLRSGRNPLLLWIIRVAVVEGARSHPGDRALRGVWGESGLFFFFLLLKKHLYHFYYLKGFLHHKRGYI